MAIPGEPHPTAPYWICVNNGNDFAIRDAADDLEETRALRNQIDVLRRTIEVLADQPLPEITEETISDLKAELDGIPKEKIRRQKQPTGGTSK